MLRKLSVTQLFSPQRIEATKALRMRAVQELVSSISESSDREEAVDISRVSFITVLNIISNILFSVDLGSYDSKKSINEFQDTVFGVMEVVGKPDAANYFPFLGFLDLQGNKKTMKVCCERLFRVFRGFIDAKIAERSSQTNPNDAPNNDLVDALLDFTEGDEAELDVNVIEHFLLLLRSPKSMEKTQAEIEHVIGQNGIVQESDISKLPYLQAVVKETFRLHPPVPLLLPRKAEADVEVLGFMVPKDTQVLVNVWAIGRDPSAWENPTQFEPERFLGNDMDVRGRDYELTPFGAGRRICPGLPLAMRTVTLKLFFTSLTGSFQTASFLRTWTWTSPLVSHCIKQIR
ncbi:unnamed protein product [Thlaspi arvense]|uniref:Cytochrome P450 76AD1-like protein n=1 Tax=Thlaspi arvense TaxID=13288 RepID=A0AAU9SBU2_THLAR|nr:unnamed protein product [Thlaspi arvense]